MIPPRNLSAKIVWPSIKDALGTVRDVTARTGVVTHPGGGSAIAVRPDPLAASAASLPASPRRFQRWTHDPLWRVAILVCAAVGAAVVTWDYSYAARHATNGVVYGTFWLGFLLVLVPASARLLGPATPRSDRLALVALLGLLDYLPKYLRDPTGPIFHDEVLNWRQAEAIGWVGAPFQPSAAPILEHYPGLHVLTDMVQRVSGLGMWQTATVVIAVGHVTVLMGVMLLAERLSGSAHVGGVAALIYSLNPSLTFFDSQYSYESLAVVFFVWVLVAAGSVHETSRREVRSSWLVTGALVAMACVVTHHVTTYSLLIALTACGVATTLTGRRGAAAGAGRFRVAGKFGRRGLWALTGIVIVAAAAWFALMATATFEYVAYHVDAGFTQVAGLLGHRTAGHKLFNGSTVPAYESWAAFLTPPVMAVASLAGVVRLRRGRAASPLVAGLGAFGFLYFVSLPFMLSVGGNEGARRSWGFTYLGLAILIGPVLAALAVRTSAARRPVKLALTALGLALVCVAQVGNVAVGVDETYRFPGPFVYGADTRSRTPEALDAAEWFERSQGPGQRVATDRYMGLVFFSAGHQDTIRLRNSYPVWSLLFSTKPSLEVLRDFWAAGYRYIVIDERGVRMRPREGVYFETEEPAKVISSEPPAAAAFSKFDRAPWARRLYGSDNLAVYGIDPALFAVRPASGVGGQP